MALDGTYTGLKATIPDFLNRSDADTIAAVPSFIKLAEAQMSRRFISRIKQGMDYPRRLVFRADASLTTNMEFFTAPTDFMGPLEMLLTNVTPPIELEYIDSQNLQREKKLARWTGAPKWYTVVGAEFQIYPKADQAYTVELSYIQKFPVLSDTNATNWILTDYPDAYLYGALTASAPFLKDDNRTEMWGTLFTTAIDDICNSDPMPTDKMKLRTETPRSRVHETGWNILTDC